eukprot:g11178.t1
MPSSSIVAATPLHQPVSAAREQFSGGVLKSGHLPLRNPRDLQRADWHVDHNLRNYLTLADLNNQPPEAPQNLVPRGGAGPRGSSDPHDLYLDPAYNGGLLVSDPVDDTEEIHRILLEQRLLAGACSQELLMASIPGGLLASSPAVVAMKGTARKTARNRKKPSLQYQLERDHRRAMQQRRKAQHDLIRYRSASLHERVASPRAMMLEAALPGRDQDSRAADLDRGTPTTPTIRSPRLHLLAPPGGGPSPDHDLEMFRTRQEYLLEKLNLLGRPAPIPPQDTASEEGGPGPRSNGKASLGWDDKSREGDVESMLEAGTRTSWSCKGGSGEDCGGSPTHHQRPSRSPYPAPGVATPGGDAAGGGADEGPDPEGPAAHQEYVGQDVDFDDVQEQDLQSPQLSACTSVDSGPEDHDDTGATNSMATAATGTSAFDRHGASTAASSTVDGTLTVTNTYSEPQDSSSKSGTTCSTGGTSGVNRVGVQRVIIRALSEQTDNWREEGKGFAK